MPSRFSRYLRPWWVKRVSACRPVTSCNRQHRPVTGCSRQQQPRRRPSSTALAAPQCSALVPSKVSVRGGRPWQRRRPPVAGEQRHIERLGLFQAQQRQRLARAVGGGAARRGRAVEAVRVAPGAAAVRESRAGGVWVREGSERCSSRLASSATKVCPPAPWLHCARSSRTGRMLCRSCLATGQSRARRQARKEAQGRQSGRCVQSPTAGVLCRWCGCDIHYSQTHSCGDRGGERGGWPAAGSRPRHGHAAQRQQADARRTTAWGGRLGP